MRPLGELLAAPALERTLEHLGGAGRDRPVRCVTAVEELAHLRDAPSESLVLLGASASAAAATYRFDIALRVAGSRRVTAIALAAGSTGVTETSVHAAERAGLSILQAAPGANLAELAIAVARELAGGADASLQRTHDALLALVAAEQEQRPSEELVAAAAAALGVALEEREPHPGELYAPVLVDGAVDGAVVAGPAGGAGGPAADLTVHLAAAFAGRARSRQRHVEEVPIQSHAELLTEILVAEPTRLDPLLERARAVRLPIDGWHIAVSFELDELPEAALVDEVASHELNQTIARIATEAARAQGGTWHRARSGTALLLVKMDREDPGPGVSATVSETAARVLQRLQGGVRRDLIFYCGVGSSHSGHAGLRASAAEARAAVTAARTTRRAGQVVSFDAVGLRRMLVEWYASHTARQAVDGVLAPIDALGPQRSATAIRTLRAYFDHQGSLRRTAEALHLHRNAVAYRIKRIFELLEIDREDPDERLMLELACRARTLT